MLGGAREFRYDWILLRARNLPRGAGGTPAPNFARRIAVNIAKLPELLSGPQTWGSVMISKRGPPQAIALGLCFGLVAHQSSRLS